MYLKKKDLLEWMYVKISEYNQNEKDADAVCRFGEKERWRAKMQVLEDMKRLVQSGAFDVDESEGTWKATSEFAFRLNDQLEAEIQRLRAAINEMRDAIWGEYVPIKVVTKINKIASEALSTTGEPTGVERVRECPECGAPLIENRWCSRVLCKYGFNNPHGINAKEKVGTEEWRHKYFGAEWPKAEGDGNDA